MQLCHQIFDINGFDKPILKLDQIKNRFLIGTVLNQNDPNIN